MKKFLALCSLFIVLTGSTFAASTGSGGTPAPTKTETAPAVTPTPTSATTTTPPPSTTAKPTTPAKTAPKAMEKRHCGMEKTIKERVSCRLKANDETIKLEQDTAFFPEGCRRGTPDWQEKCKARYKAVGPCWHDEDLSGSKYPMGKVVSCLKSKLLLPTELETTEKYCQNKQSSCPEDYRKAVYNLIVARFYDAEERAEILLEEGKITEGQAVDFLTFISESKLEFYDATTKEDRVKIINAVISEWKRLTQNVK